jgi:hypothetical protein
MDGFDVIEKIPEEEWVKLTDDQQDAFNRRIAADRDYDKSLDNTPPIALFIVGCIVGFFGLLETFLGTLGIFLCFMAILWEIIRVIDRAHRYQRVKDAEAEYKRVMGPK